MQAEYKYYAELHPDFVALTEFLDAELAEKNGSLQALYSRYNKLAGIEDIFLAYVGGAPVGCASMKRFDDETYEVKRVFVAKDFRRFGIAEEMMRLIEVKAREKGVRHLILETSKSFEPAVGLYEKLSYDVIENYGQYKGMDNSVCMKKALV